MDRHFTATTIIVFEGKVLLHWHKKLDLWLPVGGHLDPNETPEGAAQREAEEETGLDLQFYQENEVREFEKTKELNPPQHVLLIEIEPGHEHIDLIYYAYAKTNVLQPQEGESSDFKWLTAEELSVFNAPENVKFACQEALKKL